MDWVHSQSSPLAVSGKAERVHCWAIYKRTAEEEDPVAALACMQLEACMGSI